MTPTAVPSRITIDFRDAALPSRTWILGVDEAATGRMELIAFDGGAPTGDMPVPHRAMTVTDVAAGAAPAAITADCACPEFCERDHANE
jgi:hypothetical protein